MTRQDIFAEYDVSDHLTIQSPGKFETEAAWVPYFHEFTMDGSADTLDWADGASTYLVEIDADDRKEWPELPADAVAAHLEETDQGFVSCELLTAAELEELEARNEADVAEEDDGEEDDGEEDAS